ncbi:Amino acid permease OS=Streptomyces cyaneofuscatus OX=66883 GN=G3I52_10035 PE=4 SV=1 [Streptomyces cyaneofuscatus]
MSSMPPPAVGLPDELRRRLGVPDAVVVGLGSMIGAGIFGALAPAARAAGSGLLLGLALAAVVAYCNATSSARLAARYPPSGGTYVYGRERLGPLLGVSGRLGVRRRQDRLLRGDGADRRLLCLAGPCTRGRGGSRGGADRRQLRGGAQGRLLTRGIVAVVLAVLAAVVDAFLTVRRGRTRPALGIGRGRHPRPVVPQAAGLLFFAFAGYARIATLGEEARDPARTIPRAIPLALGITLVVYAAVAVPSSSCSGPAGSPRRAPRWRRRSARPEPRGCAGGAVGRGGGGPRARCSRSSSASPAPPWPWPATGTSPPRLAAVHPRFEVPHRAELRRRGGGVVAAATAVRGAIGFSSFGVLAYYAVANASAWTLHRGRGPPAADRAGPRGAGRHVVLAFALPRPRWSPEPPSSSSAQPRTASAASAHTTSRASVLRFSRRCR